MISDLPSEWFSWHGLMSALGLLVYALGSHALNQRRHPAAAIGWVMVIVLLPEVGVPLYLLFGTRKLPKAGRRVPASAGPAVSRCSGSLPTVPTACCGRASRGVRGGGSRVWCRRTGHGRPP